MTDDLRFGVVGVAGMGGTHADALEQTDGASLVAGADLDEAAADEFADEYGVAAYTDTVEMVRDADLDAACICTPNGTHADVVEDVAAEGVDILCEKPLDVTPERVARVIEACEDAGVTLGVCLQRRTLGGPRLARDAVADGTLGDLTLADVQVKWHRTSDYYDVGWRGTADLDGGVLLTQALHGIDLLQWAAGGVERVTATVETMHHEGIEVPDTAAATLEFENGAYGQISASTAVYPQYPITLQVHGTEGSVRWHEDELDEFTVEGRDDAALPDPEPFELGRGHLGIVRDFVEALQEGREPMVSGADARDVHDLVFAIAQAAETDEWVALPDR
ncbi:MAG: Gfo/Idh/MocA family protein [Halobacteriaceae archaeon]